MSYFRHYIKKKTYRQERVDAIADIANVFCLVHIFAHWSQDKMTTTILGDIFKLIFLYAKRCVLIQI